MTAEDVADLMPCEDRRAMLERTLLALLALHVIEETVSPGASIKRFDGPYEGNPPNDRCQMCLEFVEEGQGHYILTTMDRNEHALHSVCLETYMETQIQSHGRGRTNNLRDVRSS